jgi:hypothetical protein
VSNFSSKDTLKKMNTPEASPMTRKYFKGARITAVAKQRRAITGASNTKPKACRGEIKSGLCV